MGSAASRHRGPAAHLAQAAFFGALCGAGEPIDIGRYFHVIPDAIGAGYSSKPSEGLHAHFPIAATRIRFGCSSFNLHLVKPIDSARLERLSATLDVGPSHENSTGSFNDFAGV